MFFSVTAPTGKSEQAALGQWSALGSRAAAHGSLAHSTPALLRGTIPYDAQNHMAFLFLSFFFSVLFHDFYLLGICLSSSRFIGEK